MNCFECHMVRIWPAYKTSHHFCRLGLGHESSKDEKKMNVWTERQFVIHYNHCFHFSNTLSTLYFHYYFMKGSERLWFESHVSPFHTIITQNYQKSISLIISIMSWAVIWGEKSWVFFKHMIITFQWLSKTSKKWYFF